MISKADILHIVKHATKAQRGVTTRARFVNPKREWFLLVTGTLVGFLLMVGVLVLQTTWLSNLQVQQSVSTKGVSYDERTATQVIALFKQKVAEQDVYEARVITDTVSVVETASTTITGVGELASSTPLTASTTADRLNEQATSSMRSE